MRFVLPYIKNSTPIYMSVEKMVEPRRIELLSEGNLTRLSSSAVCYLHSLNHAGTNTLMESVAS